jgi:hypothetical protein
MTNEQIESDIFRFRDYLEANGARVLALTLFVEVGHRDSVCVVGNQEMVAEMSICSLAGLNGLRTVRK